MDSLLKNGAEASLRQTILTDAMSGVIVEDIMTPNVDTIPKKEDDHRLLHDAQ